MPKTPCNATVKIESSCLNYCPSFALISNAVLPIFIRKQASTVVSSLSTRHRQRQHNPHDTTKNTIKICYFFPILVVPLLTREGIYFSATSILIFINTSSFNHQFHHRFHHLPSGDCPIEFPSITHFLSASFCYSRFQSYQNPTFGLFHFSPLRFLVVATSNYGTSYFSIIYTSQFF